MQVLYSLMWRTADTWGAVKKHAENAHKLYLMGEAHRCQPSTPSPKVGMRLGMNASCG